MDDDKRGTEHGLGDFEDVQAGMNSDPRRQQLVHRSGLWDAAEAYEKPVPIALQQALVEESAGSVLTEKEFIDQAPSCRCIELKADVISSYALL